MLIESLLSSRKSIVWRTCDRNKKEHRHDSSPSRRGSNNPRMASVHYKESIQEGEDKGIVSWTKELILHSKGSQINAQEEYQRADW